MIEQPLNDVVDYLGELLSDSTVPKNIKMRIEGMINSLGQNCEISLKVNRVLNELDEIANDVNLQPYTRTQLWGIASMLEKVH